MKNTKFLFHELGLISHLLLPSGVIDTLGTNGGKRASPERRKVAEEQHVFVLVDNNLRKKLIGK